MDFNQFITAAVNNGIGFACAIAILLFAWYRETKTIPLMIKEFTEVQRASQTSFENRNTKVIDSFVKVIAEERAVCQKWHEENRSRLDQLILETKENRHYIRDLAHAVGMKKAVEEERAKHTPGKKRDEENGD
jgi:hypothetical protein